MKKIKRHLRSAVGYLLVCLKWLVLAALVGFIGQGLLTGPYILTYVFYTIFLGVLAAYGRMGKAK